MSTTFSFRLACLALAACLLCAVPAFGAGLAEDHTVLYYLIEMQRRYKKSCNGQAMPEAPSLTPSEDLRALAPRFAFSPATADQLAAQTGLAGTPMFYTTVNGGTPQQAAAELTAKYCASISGTAYRYIGASHAGGAWAVLMTAALPTSTETPPPGPGQNAPAPESPPQGQAQAQPAPPPAPRPGVTPLYEEAPPASPAEGPLAGTTPYPASPVETPGAASVSGQPGAAPYPASPAEIAPGTNAPAGSAPYPAPPAGTSGAAPGPSGAAPNGAAAPAASATAGAGTAGSKAVYDPLPNLEHKTALTGSPTSTAGVNVAGSSAKPARAPAVRQAAAQSGPEAADLLARINALRARGATCGKRALPARPPLRENPLISGVALRHAVDMAARGYFSSTSPEGVRLGKRLTDAGYIWATAAENLALAPPPASVPLENWLANEGQCKNIMEAEFTEAGAAFDVNSNLWVLILAAPMPEGGIRLEN